MCGRYAVKNKVVKWGILFLILIIIGILISWGIAENDFPSQINKDTWLGFFGSYFGGIVGAAATILGVHLTLTYQKKRDDMEYEEKDKKLREQLQTNRELEVLPYFLIKEVNDYCKQNNLVHRVFLAIEDGEQYEMFIILKNIGKGPALNPRIRIDKKIYKISDNDVIEPGHTNIVDFICQINQLQDAIGKPDRICNIVGTQPAYFEYKSIYGKSYQYKLEIEKMIFQDEYSNCSLNLKLANWKLNDEQ